MPQPKKGPRLGSNPKHQKLLLSGLALALFEHEQIRTTEAKAKALRPYAERLITKAKKGGVHERRQVLSTIQDRAVVHKLFAVIAPRFSDRSGGYTRILKLGPRDGDGAPMALVELVVGEATATTTPTGTEAPARRRIRRPGRRAATSVETGATAERAAEESVGETSDEATGEEPVEQPGDAGAATSQDVPEAEPSEDEKDG